MNRQLQATSRNIGESKVVNLKARLVEINPACEISAIQEVYSRENSARFDIQPGDYVIDAIDSLTYKLDLIEHACTSGARLFSAMGAAAKLDPTQFRVADIWETRGCPLAKLVRNGLRKRGFAGHFSTVYSAEHLSPKSVVGISCGSSRCLCPAAVRGSGTNRTSDTGLAGETGESNVRDWCNSKKIINGSAVHVTATAGMILSGLVVQDVVARTGG